MIEILNHKTEKRYTVVIKGRSICRGSQYETERRILELVGCLSDMFTVKCDGQEIQTTKKDFLIALNKSITEKQKTATGRSALFGKSLGTKRFDIIKVDKTNPKNVRSQTVSAQWFAPCFEGPKAESDNYRAVRQFVETAVKGNTMKVDGGYIVAL